MCSENNDEILPNKEPNTIFRYSDLSVPNYDIPSEFYQWINQTKLIIMVEYDIKIENALLFT